MNTQSRSSTKPETTSSNVAAEQRRGTPGRASRTAGGGSNDEAGAPPSNTAPANYIENQTPPKILRYGIDSLYLSYPGNLAEDWGQRLEGLKQAAKSQEEEEQALAQIMVGKHLFEVLRSGRSKFSYVLVDNCFQLAISSPDSTSLPLTYAQLSSEMLTALGIEEAENRLRYIVNTLGLVTEEPNLSRVDLFVDFLSETDMAGWLPTAWVTRAHKVNQHNVQRQFSGWSVGLGGVMGARLYDKTLEIKKSKKEYLKPLWEAAGWREGQTVWRLEFEYKRQVLKELGVSKFPDLSSNLQGLWHYATESWLRLTIPNHSDENQTRWPTHPLWESLAALDWCMPESPTLSRIRTERIPSDDSLFVNGLGSLTSFMAREGITDLGEGFGEYLARAHRYHNSKDGGKDSGFKEYIAAKVASKGRKYNTIHHKNQAEDDARKSRAEAYRRRGRANEYKTLNVLEAAKFLKMHPETLRRQALAGEIPSAKPGKSWVFLEADLADWLRSQYRNRRQASQGEGGNSCHLNDVVRKVSGGLDLAPPVESAYAKALRLPIDGRPKSTKHG